MSFFTVIFLSLLCANFLLQVENKSSFGIGTRIIGDQLLLKDILQTPPLSVTEKPVIKFNYAIAEPITYMEFVSDQNLYANVSFSYDNELVAGNISSINNALSKPAPFQVLIQIYGLNETFLNVNPAYILNKDQQFNGVLKSDYHPQHEALSLMQKDIKDLDDLEDYDESHADDLGDEKDEDLKEQNEFDEMYDKIIDQGKRQEGDFLVFETTQISPNTTGNNTKHSVTFYYVDIYFITYVKFTIFEHYSENWTDDNYVPPLAEYGHISPTTFKAVITDYNTKSLFVQIQVYGYHPTEVPVDYKPFLSTSQTGPMSSLKQLKLLMNAQQSLPSHKQETIANGGLPTQPNELGQQTESTNSQSNTAVNCWQQVVPTDSSASRATYSDVAIFNLILSSIVLTMIFI